jgi:alkylation response protein AidB-like acyl-CoA dehydrogenase
MDFNYSEEEQAIRDIATQIVGDKTDHASLKALAEAGEQYDAETWKALAEAGVLGASLPEAHGGAGLGFLATCAALEVIGEHAAPLPLIETVVAAALPIAEFGSDALRSELLTPIASGACIATASLSDQPGLKALGAHSEGDGWSLRGERTCVAYGTVATVIVVNAEHRGDQIVAVVDLDADGVTVEPIETTTGAIEARISFDEVLVGPDRRLGDSEVLDWVRMRVDAAIAATMAGVCTTALSLASEYAQQRQQFDRAIATFQAVSQRAADSYIDTKAVRLTAHQAAWRIDAGLPAKREVAIARWWAAEAGNRVVHASTHLHGGVGVDRDYPLHRYFLKARQLELTLGNAETQLETLGELIAQ